MKIRLNPSKRIALACSVAIAVAINWWGSPSLAQDPFRTSNPRNIGDNTEAAFEQVFQKGNYIEAKQYLVKAETTEPNEPLAYAMHASLSYLEKDWENVKTYADKTLSAAEALEPQDPLRSNLYMAVGHLLQGAYDYKQNEDAVAAITKLQQVLQYLDEAEQSDPKDPELNLVKGYLDLILAVNLPFSNPEEAIARLENYAAPSYLVDRGIAVAYRDLKQYDKALEFTDKALQSAPDNPELQYLKAQILRKHGKKNNDLAMMQQAFNYYEQALQKQAQLPEAILLSLQQERELVQKEIDKAKNDRS
ncbi:MAG: tetratricopeptide repeat protein [Hydrococcus sp. Prado102]|nr:tetratricopeptide repeat protein [Hydrococcus sp. Prado102]